jgi:hypothetical protein
MLPFPLPFCRFSIASVLSPDEVEKTLIARLARNPSIGERASFGVEAMFRRLGGQPVPLWFEGTMGEHRFRLHRFITSQNSFVPILVGNIEAAPEGSVIRVIARPHWAVLAFLVAWVGLTLCAAFLVQSASGSLLGFLLPIVGPLMLLVAFPLQLRRVRTDLSILIGSPSKPEGVA